MLDTGVRVRASTGGGVVVGQSAKAVVVDWDNGTRSTIALGLLRIIAPHRRGNHAVHLSQDINRCVHCGGHADTWPRRCIRSALG